MRGAFLPQFNGCCVVSNSSSVAQLLEVRVAPLLDWGDELLLLYQGLLEGLPQRGASRTPSKVQHCSTHTHTHTHTQWPSDAHHWQHILCRQSTLKTALTWLAAQPASGSLHGSRSSNSTPLSPPPLTSAAEPRPPESPPPLDCETCPHPECTPGTTHCSPAVHTSRTTTNSNNTYTKLDGSGHHIHHQVCLSPLVLLKECWPRIAALKGHTYTQSSQANTYASSSRSWLSLADSKA